jgi:hypothetical protein
MTFVPTTLKSIYSTGNTAGIDRYAVDQYYIECKAYLILCYLPFMPD